MFSIHSFTFYKYARVKYLPNVKMNAMAFEVRDKDLLGRIGKLETKRGTVETPVYMPVVNPMKQKISPRRMRQEFNCDIVITNSYILKKNFEEDIIDVHSLLDYDGVIATDSGAYQILVYGDVEATPDEIIEYQQSIGSDIAVILDIPTGWDVPRQKVMWTVEETLKRARAALPLIQGDDILWVGPVQGGAHLDLVEHSAKEIGKMPFSIHALGSPTEVMENYQFPVLVDMIMAAKQNLPYDRPLHLFGAGHPMMFSLAVALGCDMFDSAAYALYAKAERYLTPLGTRRLEPLRYLPCACPVCRNHDADELKDMLKGERIRLLTEHNLHVCMAEIDIIKQAITEGTLWELIEARSRAHPSLTSALKRLHRYKETLERHSPQFKGRGVFFFGPDGLARPAVTRHLWRLETNYSPSTKTGRLLLVSAPDIRPYTKTRQHSLLKDVFSEMEEGERIDLCYYAAPFGVVPEELAETYPLSQFKTVEPLDRETLEFTAENVARFVSSSGYSEVILHAGASPLDNHVVDACTRACETEGKKLTVITGLKQWDVRVVGRLVDALSSPE
jgi:7-cyano-7-deazaguanine tRNA-ribosyltransferase